MQPSLAKLAPQNHSPLWLHDKNVKEENPGGGDIPKMQG
jgi:hypothetical protein